MEVAIVFRGKLFPRGRREDGRLASRGRRITISAAVVIVLSYAISLGAQIPGRQQAPVSQNQSSSTPQNETDAPPHSPWSMTPS